MLIALLLAGVASPGLTRPGLDGPRDREDRAEAKAERKAERAADRPAPASRPEPRTLESAGPKRDFEPPHGFEPKLVETNRDRPRRDETDSVVEPRRRIAPVETVEQSAGESVREWRRGERLRDRERVASEETILRRAPSVSEPGGLVQSKRPMPRVFERAERRISTRPILGTEPPPPRTATAIAAKPARQWSHNWRNDRRYDWRDWRRRHRNRFFFGFYTDPFGWDYFRYGIGWRLWPSYYRSSFWLNDPWHWRLPPAYGPYRWVRYYNDALLVNIYTGQVVDVEYNFFW